MEPKSISVDGATSSSGHPSAAGAPDWVEPVARIGYAGKGVIYAVIGLLAVQQALGSGGGTGGSRDALREIASGAFGRIALGLVAFALAGYVIWRLVQAIRDPEGKGTSDSKKRWGMRLFYLGSAVIYGFLAYYAFSLLVGFGGGGAGATGNGGGGSGWVAELMSVTWGAVLVGAVGLGIVIRGIYQFVKAYTERFRRRIRSHELGSGTQRWVMGASRLGLTARGVIFAIIGGSVLFAAAERDPGRARGLEGALEALTTRPWLLGIVGVGLIGYAVYQWVKARYRLIGI